jgi:eight-cysteine-cluster-containing protein
MRVALLVVLAACSSSKSGEKAAATQPVVTPADPARTVLFPGGEPRFEGPSFKNDCAADGDCQVGGCSSEICTAEAGVNSACVVHPDQPREASCGCVKGECVWWKAAADEAPPAAPAAQGMPCNEGKCDPGLTCVSYYGIAGPRGPKFTSCEIPCGLAGKGCPEGQRCITIADGPGQVCRPQS